ncbi:hypothetical protein PUMCH_002408 [Australozyma saopauloensis]|uniref:Something about silencing protein 4 domain-containing protein n=1 Tax=Australozyma saopauloensis TaxID=291208 RepID=A0AAX4H979_9ASCO|nr:hypothetical protein PUMCH_002408 [[Candida] saopauloensis]
MAERKKRKLRLNHELASSNTRLLNFDNGNALLSLNQPIYLDRQLKPNKTKLRRVQVTEAQPELAQREPPKFRDLDLPHRRHRNTVDPLADEVYEPFHRRMKKDERSVTLADRSKLHFDVDNLRGQLTLLNQHDWIKHVPTMVSLNDRNDYEELSRKRVLARREILKNLEKFQDWEARTTAHTLAVKNYLKGNIGLGDEDDSNGLILDRSLDRLAKERAALRIAQHGTPVRIVLRNGFDLLAMPHRKPRIVLTGTS